MLRAITAGVCILALVMGIGLPAHDLFAAQPAGPVVIAAAGVSMDQAVKMAEQRFKARVVRAGTDHEGVKVIYVLKLLNDAGQVWTVRVDAANGAIL